MTLKILPLCVNSLRKAGDLIQLSGSSEIVLDSIFLNSGTISLKPRLGWVCVEALPDVAGIRDGRK
eukprot:12407206-Karenia_brevis.AAC.1